VSPSRELVPVAKPARGRPPRWRSALDAAWRLLRRTAHSPLVRRLALTVLLAGLAVGVVGVSYATADAQAAPPGDAQAVPGRPAPQAGRVGRDSTAGPAGERGPTAPAPSAGRAGGDPSTSRSAGGTAGQPGLTPAGRGSQPSAQPSGTTGQPGTTLAGRGSQAHAGPGATAGQPGTTPAGRGSQPSAQPSGTTGQPGTATSRAGEAADQPDRLGSRPRLVADQLGEVAVAWYAGRLGVPAGWVRALGSQRVGVGQARVLVVAETGSGRLATAWIRVHRTPGGWAVTP